MDHDLHGGHVRSPDPGGQVQAHLGGDVASGARDRDLLGQGEAAEQREGVDVADGLL